MNLLAPYLARFLIIVGIFLSTIGLYFFWEQNNPNRLAFHNYEYSKSETQMIEKDNLPTNIRIPELNLDLQVVPAEIKGQDWKTTKDGVSYLVSSPVPGEEGNSVMYAHNWAGLFRDLPQIKAGNVVEVEYADKTKKKFAIAYTLEVSPDDISVLQSSNDKRLTLYTCSGFLDSKRFIAVAMLQE